MRFTIFFGVTIVAILDGDNEEVYDIFLKKTNIICYHSLYKSEQTDRCLQLANFHIYSVHRCLFFKSLTAQSSENENADYFLNS